MTVPNWKLERYLLAELPKGEMRTLEILEKESPEFQSQLEILKKNNEELLAKYPYRRKFTVLFNVPVRLAAAFLLCATVLATVFFNGSISNENTQNALVMNEDGTRVKGLKTGLEIWRKTADSTEKLSNNSVAKAGDLLQMRYIAEEKCYGILLSLDGNGTLTVHLSGKNGKAALLEPGKLVSLENAYELDEAPKFETFYLFTDSKEFALAPIAEKLLHGKLPGGFQTTQITLKKR